MRALTLFLLGVGKGMGDLKQNLSVMELSKRIVFLGLTLTPSIKKREPESLNCVANKTETANLTS